MRIRFAVSPLIVVFALMLATALWPAATPRAFAQEPLRLDGAITDPAGAIDDEGDALEAIAELDRAESVDLFALFVETTGDQGLDAYTDDVIELNNLGAGDALLVVAVGDRAYQLWLGDTAAAEISEGEQDDLLVNDVEPELADGEYAAAIAATADGIRNEMGGGGGLGLGLGGLLPLLIVVGVLAALAFGAWWLWQQLRGNGERERNPLPGVPPQLSPRANKLLLETDEKLRTAREEAAFAEAQFTAEEVAPYRQALAAADADLKQAFTLRQMLDDSEPETPQERISALEEIIARCERAQLVIDEQQQKIDALRDVERNAPQIAESLPALIDTQEQRIPQANAQLESLARFGERSRESVRGNLVEAQKRLSHARTQTQAALAALAAENRFDAGGAVRRAQAAVTEAQRLIDGVGQLHDSLIEAEARLPDQLLAADDDIAAARQVIDARPDLRPRLSEAERALARAREMSVAAQPDLLEASRLAAQASAVADGLLADVREQSQQRQREAATADAMVKTAEASYRRAAEFVHNRRGGVGREARTRLSEAERRLGAARDLADDDPARATEEARRAQSLADDAYALAQSDFDQYDRGRRSGMPGTWGGGGGGGGLGAVLTGVLLGRMGSGMGGGFGGTRWGSPGGGRSMGGRSLGGRIGGGFGRIGGGRSRGGRF